MFEKLEEKLTALGNSVKKGTSNFTETISLNARIDDNKKMIATLYGDVGEKFYMENKDNAPEGYGETFEKIGKYFKDIDSCAEQIKKMAGIRLCPNCGADVAKGYRFCIACGTKMPEEEKKEPNGRPVCEKCGVEAEDGALFCINCGAKLPVAKEKKPERFCSRCGAKLIEGALFCTTCGEKIEQPAPEESAASEEEVQAVEEEVQAAPGQASFEEEMVRTEE